MNNIDNKQVEESVDAKRLEAFSDGVIAIIITIMVLEFKMPEEGTFSALKNNHLIPVFLAYVLSFTFVGIYWNNHHHLLRATKNISAGVMWANLHLLFWISLIPAGTIWVGENYDKSGPAALYGIIGLLAGIAYYLLVVFIKKANPNTAVANAAGNEMKGKLSQLFYALGIALAFVSPWISYALYVIVSIMWFIPDKKLFN